TKRIHDMTITIIGTGNMAKGIASRAMAGGHHVNVLARDDSKAAALVSAVQTFAVNGAQAQVLAPDNPLDDVVVLAVPYTEVATLVQSYGDKLAGKVVVDITNPVDFETFQLIPDKGVAGAEEIAKLLPASQVVKAFNTTFAGTLMSGIVDGKSLDVLIAGDDAAAKDVVSTLVGDGGLRPLDVGPLSNARHLEGLGPMHMALQEQLGSGWMSAIKFLA
ncbi:MAG: NADPH-dependent F420 reductase, partial [Candidatus Saccharibacteria bacterium]